MEKSEKNKVTNQNQFEKLVEEMEKNPSLARGFHKGTSPNNFKESWNEISNVLNALGPPRRLGDGWQKVWRDLKFKVKKKLVANKAECNATGGGIYKQCILSPLEESVANLLQFEKQVNPEGTVQGVQRNCSANRPEEMPTNISTGEEVLELSVGQDLHERDPSSTSVLRRISTPTPTRKKSYTPPKNKTELLEKHSDKQAKLLTDISNNMASVKRALRDVSNYQKKLLEIEEKKLKLMEENNKRQREMHESEMKIKKLKIMIKEKELEKFNY